MIRESRSMLHEEFPILNRKILSAKDAAKIAAVKGFPILNRKILSRGGYIDGGYYRHVSNPQ